MSNCLFNLRAQVTSALELFKALKYATVDLTTQVPMELNYLVRELNYACKDYTMDR